MIKAATKKIIPTFAWNYLRLQYLKKNLKNFKTYTVQHNYCGHPLKLTIADELAKGWYDCDWPKLQEIEFLKNKTLKEGSLVFDIGAHQGLVAQVLSKTVKDGGRIVAVEANPHNASVMKKNCALNSIKNIEIVEAAIDEQDGELFFNEGLNGKVDSGNGEWGKVATKAVCIDTLVNQFGAPDLIFLDVEGFELNAIKGCNHSFSKIKSWFIEVHADYQLQSFGGSVELILQKFPKELFQCYIANDSEREFRELSHDPASVKLMEKRFYLIALRA